MTSTLRAATTTVLLTLGMLHATSTPARAASAREISESARAALNQLYAQQPAARALGARSRGILVFPSIVKGGFIFGAEYGNGALLKYGRAVSYYNTTGVSYGFQAGIQQYGYALFFMNESALRYLDQSQGFDLGAGPSIVVIDKGMATKFSAATLASDVYAFIFDQQGLMGGMSLQGTKITRIHPQ